MRKARIRCCSYNNEESRNFFTRTLHAHASFIYTARKSRNCASYFSNYGLIDTFRIGRELVTNIRREKRKTKRFPLCGRDATARMICIRHSGRPGEPSSLREPRADVGNSSRRIARGWTLYPPLRSPRVRFFLSLFLLNCQRTTARSYRWLL